MGLFMQAQAMDEIGLPRKALELYEAMGDAAKQADERTILAHIFLKQADLYDRMGIPMSRDLHAIAAAEVFLEEYDLDYVKQALKLIP